jgi:hypothetical protein
LSDLCLDLSGKTCFNFGCWFPVPYGILNPMVNWTRGRFTSMVYRTPLLKTEPPCMVNWTPMVFWTPHF